MEKTILLSHGGGGEEMNRLINDVIFNAFDNPILKQANDAAVLSDFSIDPTISTAQQGFQLAFTTDSFVVTPLFFNGGDIGKIAVCGSVNDLCMVGALPQYLSCSFIIEEGLPLDDFKKIVDSMAQTAQACGVRIVCGDTKVVPHHKADKLFINTSAVGRVVRENIAVGSIQKGGKVLVSGDIGRHGAVILAARDEIAITSDLVSDCQPLNKVVAELLRSDIHIQAMRDATRGGLAAVLNEFSSFCKVEILIKEDAIHVAPEVAGVCELLGFEPYELANEGTFVLVVDEGDEEKALTILRKYNPHASLIGEVTQHEKARVILQNPYGTQRFLELPKGELLPRIC